MSVAQSIAPASESGPPPASSAPSTAPSTTSASSAPTTAETPDSLVGRGVQARLSGDDREALALFQRAFAIAPTPRIQAQIGFAHQALGNWVEAAEALLVAVRSADDPWVQRNRPTIDQALATIGEHVSALDIDIDVRGAEVTIDSTRRFTTPIGHRVVVPLGTVVVEVRARGYVPLRRLVVTSGPNARESIRLVPVPPPGAASTPDRNAANAAQSRTRVIAPYVIAGVGAAGLVAAGALLGARNALAADCRIVNDELICPDAASHASGQTSLTVNTAMNVAWVAGGLLVAGGVIWWAIERLSAAPGRGTRRAGVRVVYPAWAGEAVFGVGGRF